MEEKQIIFHQKTINLILLLIVLFLFANCTTLTDSNSHFFDEVYYETRTSFKQITNDEFVNKPRIVKKTVLLKTNPDFQVELSTKTTLKKEKGRYFYFVENSADTVYSKTNAPLEHSSKQLLSGKYIEPANRLVPRLVESKGTVFNLNGTCITTNIHHCNDAPCSSTQQNFGTYKIIQDTVHIIYYLSRNVSNNLEPKKTINEIQWNVVDPVTMSFSRSSNSDTLHEIHDSRFGEMDSYLLKTTDPNQD